MSPSSYRPSTLNYRVDRGLSATEAMKVLELAKENRLHALYVLALYLGMCRAKLLGLPGTRSIWIKVSWKFGKACSELAKSGTRYKILAVKHISRSGATYR